MHNLERIHSRFFPKSRTAPWGKKLIYLAWGIEILVALVSLAIAYLFNFTDLLAERGADTYVIVLALIVVAVMELTKIPLAIALYHSTRWIWRSLFVLLLLMANYSTFETIIQAFDLSYYTRLQTVDAEREKIENIKEEIKFLNSRLNTEELNQKLNEFNFQFNEASNAQKEIEINRANELDLLKQEYNVDNVQLQSFSKSLESKKEERDQEKKSKIDLESQIKDTKSSGLFGLSNANLKSLEKKIETYDDNIQRLNNEIDQLQRRYDNALSKTAGKDATRANIINRKYDALLIPINQRINNINQSISKITNQIDNVSSISEKVYLEIEEQKILLNDQQEIAKKTMQANPIYRITLRIKNRPTWMGGEKGDSVMTDITQNDLDFAFTLWFGGLALVIAVIGTGVALAGLHLQDEKMHELRNKPIKRHFVRVPILLNKYLWESIKRLKKPRPEKIVEVEKIVEKEVEVEKIVEKIVEKPVIQEKIIEKEIEVPKQIEKKVFVHVPFPTDDPEIIKKGPMIYNDKDKKK